MDRLVRMGKSGAGDRASASATVVSEPASSPVDAGSVVVVLVWRSVVLAAAGQHAASRRSSGLRVVVLSRVRAENSDGGGGVDGLIVGSFEERVNVDGPA